MAESHASVISSVAEKLQNIPEFRGLILMGSISDGKAQKGSDFDLFCVLTENLVNSNSARKVLENALKSIWKDRVVLVIHPENKVVVFLRDPLTKIDMGFGTSLEGESRYLRGSETCRVVLDKTEDQNLVTDLETIMQIRACECLPEYTSGCCLEMTSSSNKT